MNTQPAFVMPKVEKERRTEFEHSSHRSTDMVFELDQNSPSSCWFHDCFVVEAAYSVVGLRTSALH